MQRWISWRRRRLAPFLVIWGGFTVIVIALIYTGTINTEPPPDIVQNTLPSVTISPMPETPPPFTPIPLEAERFDLGVFVRETQPNVPPDVMDGYLNAARNQLNLNWIRLQIRWDFVETEAGVYNWAPWDTVFESVAAHDLNVLVTVTGTPDWLLPPEMATRDDLVAAPPDPDAFAAFIVELIRRYPNQMQALEIWQEINLESGWASPNGLNAADYVALVEAVRAAVRPLDADLLLISGALEPASSAPAAIDDFVYLDELIAADLLSAVDCVGVRHNGYNIGPDVPWDAVPSNATALFRGPYDNPHHSWSFFSTLNTYARKIAAQGSQTPLCVTEFGWAVTEDLPNTPFNLRFAADNTLQEQADWTVQAIRLMQEWGFVRLAFIWNLNIGPETGFDIAQANIAYSLIRPGYTFAPVWDAIAALDFRARED
ncbi:MAG: hypothetical protein ACLFTK_07185 [Anaerolineales bacterium]